MIGSAQSPPAGAEVSFLFALLALLVFIGCQTYPCWAIARHLRSRKVSLWLGVPAGFLFGSICLFPALGLLVALESFAWMQAVMCVIALAPLIWVLWKIRTPRSQGEAAVLRSSVVVESVPLSTGQGPASANRVWPSDTKATKKTSSERDRSSRKRLAQIEFSYIDAESHASHRQVDVFAVDQKRIEGYCHQAHATRTFLIARMQGDVVDVETGELIAPAVWARDLKKLSGGGCFASVPVHDQPRQVRQRLPAIHFTGFRQAIKDALEASAEQSGYYVAGSVVKDLRYLVTGPSASKNKIRDAEAIGAAVINREQFEGMA